MRTILAVMCVGCATAPQRHPVEASIALDAPFDDVWAAAIDLAAERTWKIDTSDKASGLLATDWLGLDDGFVSRGVDCGTAPLASVVFTRGKINLRIDPTTHPIVVTVHAVFVQRRTVADQAADIECTSRGDIEHWVQHEVARGAERRRHQRTPPTDPDALETN